MWEGMGEMDKVKCFKMGHRLDLVPVLASSGFEKVFHQDFLMPESFEGEEAAGIRG